MDKFFERSIKFLTGITYLSYNKYPTFNHQKSIFKDGWYNFIIPNVSPSELNWGSIKEVLSSEKEEGYSLSYAISEDKIEEYREAFKIANHPEFGSEFHLFKTIGEVEDNFQGEFEELSEENLEVLQEMGKKCFPEWPNIEEYNRYFLKLSKDQGSNKFKNLLYKVGGEYVGFACVIISKEDNLAYFHNAGILEEHRRKGYFTDMVNYRMKLCKEAGVTDCYSIVEKDGASYNGLKKLGFEEAVKFYLFDATE